MVSLGDIPERHPGAPHHHDHHGNFHDYHADNHDDLANYHIHVATYDDYQENVMILIVVMMGCVPGWRVPGAW